MTPPHAREDTAMREEDRSLEQDLVGFVMGCLEGDEKKGFEQLLRSNPDLARQASLLKESLTGLERETYQPPRNLAQRAIAKVAQAREADSVTIMRLPKAPPPPRPAWNWATWKIADLFVAAGVMVVAGMVAFPTIRHAWQVQREVGCSNNLRNVGLWSNDYALRNNGYYPQVGGLGSKDVAANFPMILKECGYFPDGNHPFCSEPPPPNLTNRAEVDRLSRQDPDKFHWAARRIGGSYSYNMGYRDANGKLIAPHRRDGDNFPLVADRGPRTLGVVNPNGNSPNHGGRGQNVLQAGGNVRFVNSRHLPGGDDIYLNQNGQPRAGIHVGDSSLGDGDHHP